ncbi:MAG: alpha/beta hydrolase [Paraperlucidibaca sp.]
MTFSAQLRAWEHSGEYRELKGQRHFVQVAGTGPALLLLHGFPSASVDWAPLWPQLTAHFRCYALDFLGFGLSAKPKKHRYSILDQADRAEALLRAEGVERFHILAHDIGDTVAQELLARQLDGSGYGHIDRVCLLNGGLFPETHRALLTQRLLASPLGPLVARLMRREVFVGRLQAACCHQLPEAAVSDMWALLQHHDGHLRMPQLIGYMAERQQHRERWVGALQHTSSQLRVVAGADDPISGAHMVARYQELIAQPNTLTLPGLGHYPQVEHPEQVWAAIAPFLQGTLPG